MYICTQNIVGNSTNYNKVKFLTQISSLIKVLRNSGGKVGILRRISVPLDGSTYTSDLIFAYLFSVISIHCTAIAYFEKADKEKFFYL